MTTVIDDSSEVTADEALSSTDTTDSQSDNQEDQITEQDAAQETDEEKAARLRNEAKMWEGRAKKAKEKLKEKDSPISEADLDWKIANQSRVELVKEAYDKELEELSESGAKLSNALKTKALEYAESKILPRSQESDNSLPSPSVNRSGQRAPKMTEYDIALGVKPETVAKYRDFVEGR